MGIIDILFLGIGLSMDAFAASVCKGFSLKEVDLRSLTILGGFFGLFQALMPIIGYILGASFGSYVNKLAPWIAFILLALIGLNMIREGFSSNEDEACRGINIKSIFPVAIATSIDALAVGVSFAYVPVTIVQASTFTNMLIGVSVIGIITFILSCIGLKVASVFGDRYRSRAEFLGGSILLVLGLKILLEHLFF